MPLLQPAAYMQPQPQGQLNHAAGHQNANLMNQPPAMQSYTDDLQSIDMLDYTGVQSMC